MCGMGILLFLTIPFQHTKAEGMFNFIAEPIFPKNQDLTAKGYYKLNAKPDHEQTVFIEISNPTNEKQEIDVQSVNALTTKNGGIDYTTQMKTEFTSFIDEKYAIKSWIKSEDKIVLKPKEKIQFPIHIQTPNIQKGTYLGGIMFSPKTEKREIETDGKKGAHFQMYNTYGYVIAIELNFSTEQEKNLIVKGTKMVYSPSGIQMMIEIENPNALVVKKKNFEYTVLDESGKELFKGKEDELKMAPKTSIMYPFFWKNELKEGFYQVKVGMETKDGQKTIVDNLQKVEIKQKNINEYVNHKSEKKEEIVIEKKVVPIWVWIMFGFLSLGGIALGVIIGKRPKKN